MSDLDLTNLPQATLYAVARNESAEPRYRKAAVRLMLERGYPQVNHADLSSILADVKADMGAEAEVEDIVTQATEEPMPEVAELSKELSYKLAGTLNKLVAENPEMVEAPSENIEAGPFKASFTTKNF